MGVRGPGEMRLETQRRTLRQRATRLRRNASELARRRERTRARRARNQVPSVSITGYTNAGKSALVDASAPDALGQITTVHGVLHEIGGGGQPGVDRLGEGILAQVHVAGMLNLVGEGVFLREAAAVGGVAVVVLNLRMHAAVTCIR
ncbi:GTPase HflX [Micromonospora saelicesensis]|uniref:GTPase HflX n=2 Tax=Micromonospora saelicesensis TaxID=285676 RepID=A0A328NZR3_9ACTN|nr:GTPase HflX [Micromonospora saelicesensis]